MTTLTPFSQLAGRDFTLSDFDFELPPELIAQHPTAQRSGSRLLDGSAPQVVDRIFHELPGLLNAGDLLVFNDTKVVKARIFGEKASGGKLELLIERVLPGHQVVAHMKVSKKPLLGGRMYLAGGARQGGFDAVLLGRWPDENGQLFHLQLSDEPHALMEKHGVMPLPPYIERPAGTADHADTAEDARRYQTVFARAPGAVAAPTAALHFDEGVLAALAARGAACKARGCQVVAVGTTTVRTLESWAKFNQASGDTQIFITPGFEFQVVDRLITNFHLPKSTLMMLVSAFAGYEHIMGLYRHAIAQRYRVFSYGDSMLLSRVPPG